MIKGKFLSGIPPPTHRYAKVRPIVDPTLNAHHRRPDPVLDPTLTIDPARNPVLDPTLTIVDPTLDLAVDPALDPVLDPLVGPALDL